jgi:hypothetical protein
MIFFFLKIPIRKLHMISHPSLLTASITEQFRKRYLQRMVPTPQIMPELDLKLVSHLKSNKSKENSPPPTNVFPHPHSKGPHYLLLGTPTSSCAIIFGFHHRSPQSFHFRCITLKPFSEENSVKMN